MTGHLAKLPRSRGRELKRQRAEGHGVVVPDHPLLLEHEGQLDVEVGQRGEGPLGLGGLAVKRRLKSGTKDESR